MVAQIAALAFGSNGTWAHNLLFFTLLSSRPVTRGTVASLPFADIAGPHVDVFRTGVLLYVIVPSLVEACPPVDTRSLHTDMSEMTRTVATASRLTMTGQIGGGSGM